MFYLNERVNPPTKFDMMKFFDNSGDWYDPLTSAFVHNLVKLPHETEYTVTYEEKRPDLLSYRYYNDTQYWWVLMWYNSILNVNDIVAGLIIRYPTKAVIEDLYVELSNLEKAMKE